MVPIVTFQDAVGGAPCWRVRGIQVSHCQPLYLLAHHILGYTGLVLSAWEAQPSEQRPTAHPETVPLSASCGSSRQLTLPGTTQPTP